MIQRKRLRFCRKTRILFHIRKYVYYTGLILINKQELIQDLEKSESSP